MGTGCAMFRQHHVCVRGLSQIITSLARVSTSEREDASRNLPWTQTERDKALAKCRSSQRAWCAKNPRLARPRCN